MDFRPAVAPPPPGFAQAWGDFLLDLTLKGFGSHRYWAGHKLRGTPKRAPKHPGVPSMHGGHRLRRY